MRRLEKCLNDDIRFYDEVKKNKELKSTKSRKKEQLSFSGERFIPEIHGNIELEHVHRYLFAREFAEAKNILDVACGEGYGSAMLAEKAKKVWGVDISPETIKHSQNRYKSDNLEFLVGDCADIPLSDSMVNLVVSFETLEHIDQQREMLSEVKRVMQPNGIFIVSTPDKYNYSIKTDYNNPFHKKELFKSEFIELLHEFFKNVTILGQRIVYGSNLSSDSQSKPNINYFLNDKTIETTSGVQDPLYLIALASDGSLPKIHSSFFEQPINETEIIQSWRKVVTERDQSIQSLITVHDKTVHNHIKQLAERDQVIQQQEKDLTERDQVIQQREKDLAERDQVIQQQEKKLSGLDQVIQQREKDLAGLDQIIQERDQVIHQRDQVIQQQENDLTRRDQAIQQLHMNLNEYEQEISFYAMSKSWKITRPLRKIMQLFRGKKNDKE
jgi:ubiquinone/menaquinone biosynthesis C-methylase UbiE